MSECVDAPTSTIIPRRISFIHGGIHSLTYAFIKGVRNSFMYEVCERIWVCLNADMRLHIHGDCLTRSDTHKHSVTHLDTHIDTHTSHQVCMNE